MIALRGYPPPRVATRTAMAQLLACLFVHLAYVRPAQATPRPTHSVRLRPAASIGVSRAVVQSAFEQPPTGFTFRELLPVGGQPRMRGRLRDGTAIMELIGPESGLHQASFAVRQRSPGPASRSATMRLLVEFIQVVAPPFGAADDWLYEMIIAAFQHGEATTVRENVAVALWATHTANVSTMTFTVQGK